MPEEKKSRIVSTTLDGVMLARLDHTIARTGISQTGLIRIGLDHVCRTLGEAGHVLPEELKLIDALKSPKAKTHTASVYIQEVLKTLSANMGIPESNITALALEDYAEHKLSDDVLRELVTRAMARAMAKEL